MEMVGERMNRFDRCLKIFALSASGVLIGLMNWTIFNSWMGEDDQIINAMKFNEGPFEFFLLNAIITLLIYFIIKELKEGFRK